MRDKNYKHLLGSRVWKTLRVEYLTRHPLCEDCAKVGVTRLASEVHHIVPISHETSYERMRALAYDTRNLRALCHECHEKTHEADGARLNRAAIRQRHAARVDEFAKSFLGAAESGEGGA